MKTTKNFIMGFAVLTGIAMASCGGPSEKEIKLQSQLDSLSLTDSLHKEDITTMAEFVTMMSDGLDSINGQEKELKGMGVEGKKLDKAQLRTKLDGIKELVKNQKAKIAKLEASLSRSNTEYSKRIKKLIEYYKTQLEEKDTQIAELQAQIDDKNANIATLTESVNKLTTTNTDLNKTVESQQSTIASQDETIHEAFVTIGSSKQLKAKGILTGGFLAKKKVDNSKLSAAGFNKIDIRNYNDIRLQSAKPKIMTQMPADSYEIVSHGDKTSTLHIKNVDKFWSVSKYLVIKL